MEREGVPFEKKENPKKYFLVSAEIKDSVFLPKGEIFIAESEEDAIRKMKLKLGKKYADVEVEFTCKKISRRDYEQEIINREMFNRDLNK